MGWPAIRPARSAPRGALAPIAAAPALLIATLTLAAQTPDSAGVAPPAPLPVARPADWETLDTGLPEEARLRSIVRFRYNRVDGPAPTLGAAFQTARGPAPRIFAQATYAFSRERLLAEAGLQQPIGEPPRLRVGGLVYRRTATEDAWIVGEGENTLFALFARTDYMDYYEAKGVQAALAWEPGRDVSVRGLARAESHEPLRTTTRISAFGKDDRFRADPPVERGRDRGYAVTARVGPEELPASGGTHGELLWEESGGPFSSDFAFGRLRGVVRTRMRLAPGQDLRARLVVGSTRQGALPLQKIWHLGGIGTLRGHDFKALHGDQFFLANAEYYVRARRNLYMFAFLDWGSAWFGSGNLDRQEPAIDGGVGLRVSEGPVAVTLARNLRDPGSPLKVGVRLGGAF